MATKKLAKALCVYCRREFQPTRAWHSFCSTSCRLQSQRSDRSTEYACCYCGLSCTGIDHVPPTSVRPTLVDLGLDTRYPFVEVRCCNECNSLLGARPLWTVSQRKAFMKKRLKRRYSKYLNIKDWSDSEMAQMSREMQEYIEHGLAVRALTRARLDY